MTNRLCNIKYCNIYLYSTVYYTVILTKYSYAFIDNVSQLCSCEETCYVAQFYQFLLQREAFSIGMQSKLLDAAVCSGVKGGRVCGKGGQEVRCLPAVVVSRSQDNRILNANANSDGHAYCAAHFNVGTLWPQLTVSHPNWTQYNINIIQHTFITFVSERNILKFDIYEACYCN